MEQRKPKELVNYPIRSDRRKYIILDFIKNFENEEKDYILKSNYTSLKIYWAMGINPNQKEIADKAITKLIKINKSDLTCPPKTNPEVMLG